MASPTQAKEGYMVLPANEPKYHSSTTLPSTSSDIDIEKQQPSTKPAVYGTFQRYTNRSSAKDVEKRSVAAHILLPLAASVLVVAIMTACAYVLVLVLVG